jgi:hypothetical protein
MIFGEPQPVTAWCPTTDTGRGAVGRGEPVEDEPEPAGWLDEFPACGLFGEDVCGLPGEDPCGLPGEDPCGLPPLARLLQAVACGDSAEATWPTTVTAFPHTCTAPRPI